MAGFRAYFEFNSPPDAGDTVILNPEESRHLCGSLRAQNGDFATLFNLDGALYEAQISDASQKAAALKVLTRLPAVKTQGGVFLAQCLPASSVFDEILRQSVEAGAAGIYPLFSENSQVRLGAQERTKKMQKWRHKVIEAVKQSANFAPFALPEPKSFAEFLRLEAPSFDAKIIASLQANAKPLLSVLKDNFKSAQQTLCILIGPEGDFSKTEHAAALDAGFTPASLGRNVLKCDTAAISCLSTARAHILSLP